MMPHVLCNAVLGLTPQEGRKGSTVLACIAVNWAYVNGLFVARRGGHHRVTVSTKPPVQGLLVQSFSHQQSPSHLCAALHSAVISMNREPILPVGLVQHVQRLLTGLADERAISLPCDLLGVSKDFTQCT